MIQGTFTGRIVKTRRTGSGPSVLTGVVHALAPRANHRYTLAKGFVRSPKSLARICGRRGRPPFSMPISRSGGGA